MGVMQMDFGRRIGFTQSYISQILNGSKGNPSSRFYDAVCRAFNVNSEWLKKGKGQVYAMPGGDGRSADAELLTKFRILPKQEQRLIEDMVDALLVKSLNAKNGKKVKK